MAPTCGKIKTRVCIISDTHNQAPSPTCPFFTTPLPTADVLIHAGDLTYTGKHAELAECVAWLRRAPAPLKLVIPGNHDITLDAVYYPKRQWQHHRGLDAIEDPAACKALLTNADAVAAGIVYIEEGTRTFELANGTRLTVYASAYTPAFCNWAFDYPRVGGEDRFNPVDLEGAMVSAGHNPVPTDGVDIMVTHGPPHGILDSTAYGGEHVGCERLRKAVERVRPLVHCFGHIHEAYGAVIADWEALGKIKEVVGKPLACIDISNGSGEKEALGRRFESGRDTLLVNASIMNLSYKPLNAPWIVDLDLPPGEAAEVAGAAEG